MNERKLGWDIGTVKAEGNYMLEGREYCKHDHIPRKCDSCDYEEEIDKLRAALEEIANPGEKYTFAVYKTMLERAELIAKDSLK